MTGAGIIALGLVGSFLFAKTKFSDVLILVGLGVLLNLVFGLSEAGPSGFRPVDAFILLTPYVGAVALITILFDGGLTLKLRDLFKGLAQATLLSALGFVLTMLFVAAIAVAILDVSFLLGLLLGAILGGTSAVIVMPLVSQVRMGRSSRTLLSLESALTDVLVVVVALTLTQLVASGPAGGGIGGTGFVLRSIVTSFSIAILLGILAGFGWIRIRGWVAATEKEYILTLAALFLLYSAVSLLGGSGAIAVLAFGIVLGNSKQIGEALKFEKAGMSRTMLRFHSEITFFIRTFFFVYLGLILDVSVFSDLGFIAISVAILLAIAAARWATVQILAARDKTVEKDKQMILLMMPRGLAAAVLAALPASAPYNITAAGSFVGYTFAVIVLTNILATAAVLVLGKSPRPKGAPMPPPA